VKTWWLSNEETMDLRSENDWTIDLQPHTVTAVHVWTIKGAHARFVTYEEHTVKCKTGTILVVHHILQVVVERRQKTM
jgi:hypothetical protein